MGLHFVSTTPAEEAELNIIRTETGRRVALCRKDAPSWGKRYPLRVWMLPCWWGVADPEARLRMEATGQPTTFDLHEVEPERFPALAARIVRADAEDDAALLAEQAQENVERGQCEALL